WCAGREDRRGLFRQVAVPVRDAGVDDGHADALAGVAEKFLHRASADRDRRPVDVPFNRAVEWYAEDLALAGQLLEQVVWQLEEHAVDQVQVVVDAVGIAVDGEAPQ